MKTLSRNRIPTWVFVAPTLPCLSDTTETLNQIFRSSQNSGAHSIMFDTLNPYPKVWHNVMGLIRKHFPELEEFYEYYYHNREKYGRQLKRKISQISRNYKITSTCAF
jgi:DNA repair photolyase